MRNAEQCKYGKVYIKMKNDQDQQEHDFEFNNPTTVQIEIVPNNEKYLV